jgi:hypothetical protein
MSERLGRENYHQKLTHTAYSPGIGEVVLDIVVVFLVRRHVAVPVEALVSVVISAKQNANRLNSLIDAEAYTLRASKVLQIYVTRRVSFAFYGNKKVLQRIFLQLRESSKLNLFVIT